MAASTLDQRKKAAKVVTPIGGAIVAPGQSGIFMPLPKRPFNVTIAGGVGVVAQLERRFPGDATWYVKVPDSMRATLPETFPDTESEAGVAYRVNVTAIASGSVTVRLSQ